MKKENEKSILLKREIFEKNNPNNPKNINAQELLKESRKMQENDKKSKCIIINGKEI